MICPFSFSIPYLSTFCAHHTGFVKGLLHMRTSVRMPIPQTATGLASQLLSHEACPPTLFKMPNAPFPTTVFLLLSTTWSLFPGDRGYLLWILSLIHKIIQNQTLKEAGRTLTRVWKANHRTGRLNNLSSLEGRRWRQGRQKGPPFQLRSKPAGRSALEVSE